MTYEVTYTGDPRFTRFQFARIHTARFFQGLCSMGKMGSTEPLGFQKIALKLANVEKFNETVELWL